MRTLLVSLLVLCSFQWLIGQTKQQDSIINILENYKSRHDIENLIKVTKEAQKKTITKTASDSLYLAKLFSYESHGIKLYGDLTTRQKLYNKIISICPNNHEGLVLKAITISNSTTIETIRGFDIMAYQKMEKSLAILESLEGPTPFLTLLRLNSELAGYTLKLDETEKYKNYILKAHQIFNNNTIKPSDKLDFYVRSIQQLYTKDTKEEIILDYFNKIKKLDLQSSDASYEYKYAMAKIDVARFYLNQLKKGNKEALKKAYKYIDNVLSNSKEDRMMNYYKKTAWFEKNELLLAESKLEAALKGNTELINFSRPNEARMRLNLHQRIRIVLKLKRYKEALKIVEKMVNQFHIGLEDLKPDYSNFDAGKKLNYVSLFLDLSDAFKEFEKKDLEIRKTIVKLNKLSLNQFQNSIDNKLTTPKTKTLFKRIISNFIATKHYDLGYGITTPKFLETIENIENTLGWQEFLQNRTYAKLSFINDFKYENAALRNQLVKARKNKQDSTVVEIKLQLNQLQKTFKEKHPNYSKIAFSEFKTTEFQDKILKDEVILKYENIKDSLYTFIISKNDVKLINIGHSQNISTSINTYITNLTKRVNTDSLAKKIYQQIIPKQALTFNQINIIPDSFLYKLPFEALQNSDGDYLIKNKTILYAPYLSLFKHDAISETKNNKESNTNLMIFTPSYEDVVDIETNVSTRGNAYRLVGAEKESKLLANVFDNASFSNYSATKENFKEHAPKAQLLHLSMHADIDPVTPELKALVIQVIF